MSHKLRLRVSVLCLAFAGVLALASAAGAADRQPTTFTAIFFAREQTVTELGNNTVRVDVTNYFGVGGRTSPGDEASASLTWLYHPDQGTATVSGQVTFFNSLEGLLWVGEIHGRMTPDGLRGVYHATQSETGQRLVGTWTKDAPVDPTDPDHIFGFDEFTGTILSP